MLRYLAALLLIPLLDALLLVVVATQIGAPLTVLIVVLTALLGMLLVRAEGRHTLAKIQQKLAAGEVPTDEVLDGALLLIAGALTLTPGLITDFVGILLVVPVTRMPIRALLRDRVVVPYLDEKSGGFTTGNVYVGGFPFENGTDGSGVGGAGGGPGGVGGGQGGVGPQGGPFGPGGPGDVGGGSGVGGSGDVSSGGSETVDIDDDAYEVEFEDDDSS